MPIQRQTAKKARIVDLVGGEWVRKEGMEPSYVVTPGKESVSRARISGTVVGKFVSEDGNFASVTIDDSTATIQAKVWKETGLLKDVNVGDIISLIGKVREYEGDIYIVPEVIRKTDPDQEILFRLEILASMKRKGEGGEEKAEEPEKSDEEQLRKKILSIIEASEDGIKYSKLLEKAGVPEEAVENIINELLGEGICYEPTPGKIKKI
jgi:RPA family protein